MSRVGPSPCKDCTDRVVGCHSECERYKTWKVLELWANEMEEPKE